jgi:hypothetical protein
MPQAIPPWTKLAAAHDSINLTADHFLSLMISALLLSQRAPVHQVRDPNAMFDNYTYFNQRLYNERPGMI